MKKWILLVISSILITTNIGITIYYVASKNMGFSPNNAITENKISENKNDTITIKDVRKTTASTGASSEAEATNEVIRLNEGFSYNTYLNYLLNNTDESENAIISPESINTILYMYSRCINNPKEYNDFLQNKDYLNYKDCEGYKSISRLWVNDNMPFYGENDEELYKIIYLINTRKEGATQEKNDYVSEQTEGYIKNTATKLNPDTIFETMNIIYFKNEWENSKKSHSVSFTNDSDTISEVDGFLETSKGTILKDSNATAYTMKYANGFTFTAIRPDDGYGTKDVNIDNFIKGNIKKEEYDEIAFLMPEFEAASYKIATPKDFGLVSTGFKKDIWCDGTIPFIIPQTVKLTVDKNGSGEEIPANESVDEANRFSLVMDKPFLYYVTDTLNEDIVFIGTVNYLEKDYDAIPIPEEYQSESEKIYSLDPNLGYPWGNDKNSDINLMLTYVDNKGYEDYPFKNIDIIYHEKEDIAYGINKDVSVKEPSYYRCAVIKDGELAIYNVALLLNNMCFIYKENINNNLLTYKSGQALLTDAEKKEIRDILYDISEGKGNEGQCDKLINKTIELFNRDETIKKDIKEWYPEFKGCIYGNG